MMEEQRMKKNYMVPLFQCQFVSAEDVIATSGLTVDRDAVGKALELNFGDMLG